MIACAARRQAVAASPAPKLGARAPLQPNSGFYWKSAAALRGRRQGAAAPPAPPAQGVAPGNPNLMHRYAKNLVYMPTGRSELAAAHASSGIPEACEGAFMLSLHHLQGVWGAARPPSGEREGQSPLASLRSD